MFAAILAAALLYALPTLPPSSDPPKSIAQVEHVDSGLSVTGMFADGFAEPFIIDTGATVSMMDSYNLFMLALHHHATIVGGDFIVGIDGQPFSSFIYRLDKFTVGNCTLRDSDARPLLMASGPPGSPNIIGREILNNLGTYSLNDTSFSFDCPR